MLQLVRHWLGLDPIPECEQEDTRRREERLEVDSVFRDHLRQLTDATTDLRTRPKSKSLAELEAHATGARARWGAITSSSTPETAK